MTPTLKPTLFRHTANQMIVLTFIMLALSTQAWGEGRDAPKHEMRGAWIATVYGIDWPSQTGSTAAVAELQKKELCHILDILEEAGMNAAFLQVRSMSDAFYHSSLEPWSAYLTGTRGTAPAKGWDPLGFAVDEAHKRGMELHAWVNPFRFSTSAKLPSTPSDRKAIDNGWVLSYRKHSATQTKKRSGKKAANRGTSATLSILDPGNADARKHIVAVCREIVRNYDIDGLVFDDYFYPEGFPFAENEDPETGGEKRRRNVAETVREVYRMIQNEKPWVRFGISPAGVGGGNGKATAPYGLKPPSVGHDWMYDRIFCNPLDWLAEGTVDYVSPQIYWSTDHATNPFGELAKWWASIAVAFGRHFYASQKVLALPAGQQAWEEQAKEISLNRQYSPDSPGSVFYSTAHITGKKASGLSGHLRGNSYSTPAMMPAMEWKEAADPGRISGIVRKGADLNWMPQHYMRYVVYAIPADVNPLDALADNGRNFRAEYIIGITYGHRLSIPADKMKGYWYAVAPYDRYGNEWEAVTIDAPGW